MTLKHVFLIGFLVFPSFSFAQDQTASVVTVPQQTPQEQMNSILNNFSKLNYEKRKENFALVLNQIELFRTVSDKDLFLARLFLLYRGEKEENISKALTLIEKYLKNNPNSPEGYCMLADILRAKMSLDGIFLDPSEWKNKEDLRLRKDSLRNIDKALAINSNYAKAYRIKGELSEGEEKIKFFEKAIELDQSYDEAWRDLLEELNRKNRYDEALKALDSWWNNNTAAEISIEINMKRGDVYRQEKEFDKAIVYLEKALTMRDESGSDGSETIYSEKADIYNGLANVYLENKDYKNAEIYFVKYLEIYPKAWYVRFNLAKLYHDNGEKDKAIVQYEQVLAYNNKDTSSMYNLGLLYKDTDPDKAKELFTKYVKLEMNKDSDYSRTWVNNAKSQLSYLGVYNYPKSKKEVREGALSWIRTIFLIGIAVLIIGSIFIGAWKFKIITKWVVLAAMVLGLVLVSLNEANSYRPNIGKAFLFFIPILCIGGFLLYIFKKK